MFTDLLFDNNNNLYFCGYISADTIDLNYSLFNKDIQKSGLPLGFIGRYSSENVLEKFIWIGGDQSDYLNGILLDTNNNIHIFGDSNSTSITFDNVNYVNPNPNIVPVENFVLNSLITKYNLDIPITPPTPPPLPIKLRAINLLWLDGSGDDSINQTAIDSNGYIYYVGSSTSSSVEIGSQTFIKPEGSTYNYGLFFCKIDPITQTVIWIKWVDTSKNEFGYNITITKNDNIIISGQTNSASIIIDSVTYTKY